MKALNTQELAGLTVQEITDKIEEQRVKEMKQVALGMKGSLVQGGRCPKCTLKPPCNHFDSVDALPNVEDIQPKILKSVGKSDNKYGRQSDLELQIMNQLT